MYNSVSNLRLTKTQKSQYYVSLYVGTKRYRYFNGKVLGLDIAPNREPIRRRSELASLLLIKFREAIARGWTPEAIEASKSVFEAFRSFKPHAHYTKSYQRELERSRERFLSFLEKQGMQGAMTIRKSEAARFLEWATSTPSTFNHEHKHLSSIWNSVLSEDKVNPFSQIKKKREKQELHKPFGNVAEVLEDIRKFNKNLHLCCLLTYGCLLRPHQEIRNLKWSDFSEDLSYISLSGKRNKSGRNRIVPIPDFVKEFLCQGDPTKNIFSGKEEPYREGYFKVLWRRYANQSCLLNEGQTLYSFRHTAAICIFTNSGSIATLQSAMGHSSLLVTTTYLRGLSVPQLSRNDMPNL